MPSTLIDTLCSFRLLAFSLQPFPIFKPTPPIGAGGGYMFSGRPSVRPSVIHVVVSCFRDISSICWQIFAKLLSLVHLGTQMTWLRFGVKRSKFKVTPSRRRRTALDAVPSSATFSSLWSMLTILQGKLLAAIHQQTAARKKRAKKWPANEQLLMLNDDGLRSMEVCFLLAKQLCP